MSLGPAAGVRLVGTLTLLRSRHLFLETLRVRNPSRAQDETSIVNKKSQNPKRYPSSRVRLGHAGQTTPRLFETFRRSEIWIWGFGFAGATVASPGWPNQGRWRRRLPSVSPPSFPQLWKTLWKIPDYRTARWKNLGFTGFLPRRNRRDRSLTGLHGGINGRN